MTSREQFEAWCINHLVSITKTPGSESYNNPRTIGMWRAWQASRAAIEIQVCPYPNNHGPHVDDHYREQINNAGLKVKK